MRPRLAAPRPRAAAFSVMLAARRAWVDSWVLAMLVVLVGTSSFLALAVPRILAHSLDAGARAAVASAPDAASVVAQVALRINRFNSGDVGPEPIDGTVKHARGNLPPALRAVAGTPTGSAVSPYVQIHTVTLAGQTRPGARSGASLGFGYLPGEHVRYVIGRAPDLAPLIPGQSGLQHPIEVAVSTAVSDALDLPVGATVEVGVGDAAKARAVVTGVFEPLVPDAPAWRDLPTALAPADRPATTVRPPVTLAVALVSPADLGQAQQQLAPLPFTATFRIPMRSEAFSSHGLAAVRDGAQAVLNRPGPVFNWLDTLPDVTTSLPSLITSYQQRERAVTAEVSVVVVGVVVVAILVSLLAAQLLVERRRETLALEHARGWSGADIALRLLVEAVVVTAVGVGLGILAAWLVAPATPASDAPLWALLAVAVAGAPVLGWVAATRRWGRRRVDVAARGRRGRGQPLRRLVVEGALVVLAVAGVVALRKRGALQGQTPGVDLFLSAAPVLVAAVVTIVVLRAYPWPLRGVVRLADRRPGVVTLLGAARATRAAAGSLALLTLTLAVALVVSAGMLRTTVLHGQQTASWQRVGADVRVHLDDGVSDRTVAKLAASPGVTHVASGYIRTGVNAFGGSRYFDANVALVDSAAYGALLASTPLGYQGELAGLTANIRGSRDALPVVTTADIASRMAAGDGQIFLTGAKVSVSGIGAISVSPRGWLSGSTVFADLGRVNAVLAEPVVANTVWVTGPGAEAAVSTVFGGPSDASIWTRTAFTKGLTGNPLVGGAMDLMWLAVGAVAAYSLVALLLVIISTSRQRGQTLSYLRTLGLTARQGRWISVLELAPTVVVAGIAGALAGLGIVILLQPALGIGVLTDGITAPILRIDPWFVVGVVGGLVAILAGAVGLEVAANRRTRLGGVLRVGDAR